MAGEIIIGRKPAANKDVGVGELAINECRLTWLSTPTADYWVTHLGAHVGWDQGGTPPWCRVVVYNANTAAYATTRLAMTDAFQTRARYFPYDPYGGENIQRQLPAPVLFKKNQTYLGGVHTTGRWMTMGQSNDGSLMSRDYGNSVPPSSFQTERRDPQGRLAMWVVARKNSAPYAPRINTPAANSQTTSLRPRIQADFRDPDETLSGFGVGKADKLSAFQIIIYNDAKTSKLWDSGIVAPTTAEVNARAIDRTPPSNLPTAPIRIWVRMRDLAGAWSPATEWRVTILSGGSVAVTGPTGRITTTQPAAQAVYTHRSGSAMKSVEVEVVSSGGTSLRGPLAISASVSSGGGFTVTWPTSVWSALPRGTDAYFRMRPTDVNNTVGAWSPKIATFKINRLPLAPANLSPASGEVRTEVGVFRATVTTDADGDSAKGFTVQGKIWQADTPETVFTFPMFYKGMSGTTATFEGRPTDTMITDHDTYQWSVQAWDQMGEASPVTGPVSFNYAEPPEITITSPAGSTVDMASPTVTFTSSPSASEQRVRWVDGETGEVVHDSMLVSATGSNTVPSGAIRTGRSYDVYVGVKTGLGAYGETVKRVDVSFALPDPLENVHMTLEMAKYDQWGQPTLPVLRWEDPDEDASDFRGYGVYRKVLHQPEELVAVLVNPDDRSYGDDTIPFRTTVQYWVTRFEEEGVDIVESPPPDDIPSIEVTYDGTVISDVDNPGENRVVAPYWLNREEVPVRARDQRDGWGTFPITFHGERQYRRMSGTWDVIEDVGYTATELKDSMVRLSDPVLEERMLQPIGGDVRTQLVLRPRTLCYRDGLGRVLYGNLTIQKVEDTHQQPHDVSWVFVETGLRPVVRRPMQVDPEMANETALMLGLFGRGDA